ncbi:MAG: NAD-dependent protein deacylase [Ethanoligenens sp.]
MDEITTLADWLMTSQQIVAFTGAGVSTESNIPDFRSAGGVYERIQEKYGREPEVLLSHRFFMQNPKTFFEYLREYLVFPDAEPNDAHRAFAALEREGKLSAVVTQNIDGLHSRAGSKTVYELHGSVYRSYCMSCGKQYSLESVLEASDVPRCMCGGIIRPDVVLYGEGLDSEIVTGAVRAIEQADLLIVAGTSLAVYPAAGLIDYFQGKHLVLLNKSETPHDRRADLCIHAAAGVTLRAALEKAQIKIDA